MLNRRTILKAFIASSGIVAGGFYLVHDDTDRTSYLEKISLKNLANSEAIILSLIITVIIADQEQLQEEDLTRWLTNIDEALSYLPTQQKNEFLLLLDTLTFKLGRLILNANFSKWQELERKALDDVLSRWRFSSRDVLNVAYLGVKQLIMAVWYGESENWKDTGYPGPLNLGGR